MLYKMMLGKVDSLFLVTAHTYHLNFHYTLSMCHALLFACDSEMLYSSCDFQ